LSDFIWISESHGRRSGSRLGTPVKLASHFWFQPDGVRAPHAKLARHARKSTGAILDASRLWVDRFWQGEVHCVRMGRAFSASWLFDSFTRGVAQAGMKARRWCFGARPKGRSTAALDSGVQPEAREVCRKEKRDRLDRLDARPRVRAMDCNGRRSREDARRGEWDVRPPLSVFSVCFCSESHCQLKLSPPSGGSRRESSVEPPQSTL